VCIYCITAAVCAQAHVSSEMFFLRAKFLPAPSRVHTFVRNLETIILQCVHRILSLLYKVSQSKLICRLRPELFHEKECC